MVIALAAGSGDHWRTDHPHDDEGDQPPEDPPPPPAAVGRGGPPPWLEWVVIALIGLAMAGLVAVIEQLCRGR